MVLNMFGRRTYRQDTINGHSRCHSAPDRRVQFSSPLETASLPPVEPFIPLYSFSPLYHQYGDYRFVQGPAMPQHRMAQPRRGILRDRRPSVNYPVTPIPNIPGTPSSIGNQTSIRHNHPYDRAHRRNSFSSQPGWPYHTPYQAHTPLQYYSFPPPPAPIQPTFGPTVTIQHSGPPLQARHTPASAPESVIPVEPPSLQQWNLPTGTLSWSPHPAPHPNVPAAAFWSSNNMLRGLPQTPRHCAAAPLDPWGAVRVTGGWPLPGADPNWTPGSWPPTAWGASVPIRLAPSLIPNPANPDLPQIVWDVSQNPTRARRITGAHIIVDLSSQMNQQAIVPATQEVHIAIQASYIQRLWGTIKVRTKSNVVVWDILNAIYEYFQTPLKQSEVDYLQSLDPSNYDILVDACHARCKVTPALPGFEQSQGLKRVDLLGDQRVFWGLWVSVDEFTNSWHLNLGLVNLRPGQPMW